MAKKVTLKDINRACSSGRLPECNKTSSHCGPCAGPSSHASKQAERRRFGPQQCEGFATTVQRAARSLMSEDKAGNGPIHSHQRRCGHAKMEEVATVLVTYSSSLRGCKTFDDLQDCILSLFKGKNGQGGISGVGELAAYDIAVRIGYALNLAPEFIYLHAGTREGAANVGITDPFQQKVADQCVP